MPLQQSAGYNFLPYSSSYAPRYPEENGEKIVVGAVEKTQNVM